MCVPLCVTVCSKRLQVLVVKLKNISNKPDYFISYCFKNQFHGGTNCLKSLLKKRKTTTEKTKSQTAEMGFANMVDLTGVLNDMKALYTEFGSKLDGTERHVNDVSDSVKSLENGLSVVNQMKDESAKRKVVLYSLKVSLVN